MLVIACILPLAIAADSQNNENNANKRSVDVPTELDAQMRSSENANEELSASETSEVETIKQKANKMMEDQRPDKAEELLKDAVDKKHYTELADLLANCYMKMGNKPAAEKYAGIASDLHPNDKRLIIFLIAIQNGVLLNINELSQNRRHYSLGHMYMLSESKEGI